MPGKFDGIPRETHNTNSVEALKANTIVK